MSDRIVGMSSSTSEYACIIQFIGGGPYDGKSGLYDNDFANHTIQVAGDDENSDILYDYNRAGPKLFRLSRVWVKCGEKFVKVQIWDPETAE